ncbi:MAG: hypothetical protein M1834_001346 [Cirrosporium novae-zelandiae]|nr:MAG: hypothetical protein M1834_001346 [Cirrosporium novae-zelandiae]
MIAIYVAVFAIILLYSIITHHQRSSIPPAPSPDSNNGVVSGKISNSPPPTASPIDGPLPRYITNSDEDTISRSQWVIRLTSYVHTQRYGKRYNVATLHTTVNHHFAPEGVVERISLKYVETNKARLVPYECVVFRKGSLAWLGDGGYINWCFLGNFVRMGNFVTFEDPGES